MPVWRTVAFIVMEPTVITPIDTITIRMLTDSYRSRSVLIRKRCMPEKSGALVELPELD